MISSDFQQNSKLLYFCTYCFIFKWFPLYYAYIREFKTANPHFLKSVLSTYSSEVNVS